MGTCWRQEFRKDLLEQAKRWRMGEPLMLSGTGLQRTLYEAIVDHLESAATVYDSVAALRTL